MSCLPIQRWTPPRSHFTIGKGQVRILRNLQLWPSSPLPILLQGVTNAPGGVTLNFYPSK